jgi:HK97 gp10 family phage protein
MDSVTGLEELQASIAALNAQLNNELPAIVLEGAEIVEEEIRARAPVLSGAIVRSLDAKSERRKDAASAIVQVEASGPDGTEHYAIFQEFGTSRMRAQPFFRPGVLAAQDKVQAHSAARIAEIIGSKE